MPRLVENGLADGLAIEATLRKLLEVHQKGETLELSRVAEWLDASGQRLVYECAMEGGESPDRDMIVACMQSLEFRKADRARESLQSAIQAAESAGDQRRLAQLLEAKTKLIKEMDKIRRSS